MSALKGHNQINRTMNNGLHRLEKMMRYKIFQDSFKNILSIARSKTVHHHNSHCASMDILSTIMRHVLKRKLKRAFMRYKQMTFLSTSGHEKMKRCVSKMANWRLRVAFHWWKK
jgi:retron-type reverse transcriptase